MTGAPDLDDGARQAVAILRRSAGAEGFVASAGDEHYGAVWTRDAAFAAMGATVSGDEVLVGAVRTALTALATVQSRLGQLPDAWWPRRWYWDFGEAGATDATALYVVMAVQFLQAHRDEELRAQLWPHLERAMSWLAHQDANGFGVIDSPEAADWMDSSICRSGKLLYTNVLYARAARGMASLAPSGGAGYVTLSARLHRAVNLLFWPVAGMDHATLLDRGAGAADGARFPHPASATAYRAAVSADRAHYVSHVQWGRLVDECDVLGNVLAVLFDIADPPRARRIMESLRDGAAVQPYPARTYPRVFTPADDPWQLWRPRADAAQSARWRNPPGAYHNGGVWPFIGGLYVAALHHVGMHGEAATEMERLAAANRLGGSGAAWGFHEWIHALTGEPGGAPDQSWSAGTYLLAHRVLSGADVTH